MDKPFDDVMYRDKEQQKQDKKNSIRSDIKKKQDQIYNLQYELEKYKRKLELLYQLKRKLLYTYNGFKDKLGRNKNRLQKIYKLSNSNNIVKGYHTEMDEILSGKNATNKIKQLDHSIDEVQHKIEEVERKIEEIKRQLQTTNASMSRLWSEYRSQ